MAFVQNFPAFCILLTLICAVVTSVLKRKSAVVLTTFVLVINLVMNVMVTFAPAVEVVADVLSMIGPAVQAIGNVIGSLASAQDSLADSLRSELRSLNMNFTGKIASAVFGEEAASSYISNITTAARIPGVVTLLSEESEGAVAGDFRDKMADLIAEDVQFVTATADTAEFVSGVLGGMVDPANIVCDRECNTVIIRTDEKDAKLYNRLRLLEQIAPYKIGG